MLLAKGLSMALFSHEADFPVASQCPVTALRQWCEVPRDERTPGLGSGCDPQCVRLQSKRSAVRTHSGVLLCEGGPGSSSEWSLPTEPSIPSSVLRSGPVDLQMATDVSDASVRRAVA